MEANKTSDCSTVSKDGEQDILTTEQVIKLASSTAVEQYRKEKAAEKQRLKDKRLHNTKLLLQNYRRLVQHCNAAVSSLTVEQINIPIKAILDTSMDDNNELMVESIFRTRARTEVMIEHVKNILECYGKMCEYDVDGLSRLHLIEYLYINPLSRGEAVRTHETAAAVFGYNVRTVYRKVDVAIKEISALMFGIEGFIRTQ